MFPAFLMHTGTLRKMPAKLAGARRASREDAFPTRLHSFVHSFLPLSYIVV